MRVCVCVSCLCVRRLRQIGVVFGASAASATDASRCKAEAKLSHLFPSMPLEFRCELRLDDEASYSVSDEKGAEFVAALAQRLAPGAVAVDATACVGGNTLALARFFKKVVAIELDEHRCF